MGVCAIKPVTLLHDIGQCERREILKSGPAKNFASLLPIKGLVHPRQLPLIEVVFVWSNVYSIISQFFIWCVCFGIIVFNKYKAHLTRWSKSCTWPGWLDMVRILSLQNEGNKKL